MLHVKRRASLDLGLKELWYMCSVLVLSHDTTGLSEIPSESMSFQWIGWTPSDDFPTLLEVFVTVLWIDVSRTC